MSVSVTKARRLIELKEEKVKTEKVADAANSAYRQAEADFWMDLEDDDDITIVKDLGAPYGRVQFQKRETITGRVLNDEQAVAALTRLGLDDAVLGAPSVRQKVLSEFVREWLRSGQPLPEGIDHNTRRYVAVTRK